MLSKCYCCHHYHHHHHHRLLLGRRLNVRIIRKQAVKGRSASSLALPQGICSCWDNSAWNTLPWDVHLVAPLYLSHVSGLFPHQRGLRWPPLWKIAVPSPPATWLTYMSVCLCPACPRPERKLRKRCALSTAVSSEPEHFLECGRCSVNICWPEDFSGCVLQ